MGDNKKRKRPGEAALENMKLLKCESSIFKVPKVPKMKNTKKTKVLDEELYVEGIAKIIQRDFFPDLEKLNAQNEFLDATENKDYDRLREITRKYSGHRPPTEPYNSPATFDTPDIDRPMSPLQATIREQKPDKDGGSTSTDKHKEITDNHTLDSFLASHTSEDNSSYDRVIALEQKKLANKLAPQFDAEVKSIELADKALALPSIEEQADQTERPHEVGTWRYKARNHIMYVPDRAASQQPPPKPDLVHVNTRLKAEPFDHVKSKEAISAIAKSQDASSSGRIGVDGTSASADKSKDYPLVATPSPRPGAGPDASPLMTWGEIEGTPFRLDGGDTPLPAVGAGAAYRMLEGGARERIALQLAERLARRRRTPTPLPSPRTPNFRTNTERLASMSPAARMLAAKHLLLSPRLKLTPNELGISHHTPKPTKSTTPRPLSTPRVSTPPASTPLVSTPKKNTPVASSENNLTDNLLQINVAKRTRLRAQDFFFK